MNTPAMQTLLLDTAAWDLVADAAGNIAVASPPYALAQDVASAIRTFLGEVYYDTSLGVPYFQKLLNQSPPASLFQTYMVDAALTVPGVVSATCVIESLNLKTREVTGQVQFVDNLGNVGEVTL